MNELKIGDIVKLSPISEFYNSDYPDANPNDINGKIIKVDYGNSFLPIWVKWKNGIKNTYNTKDLVKIKNSKMTISRTKALKLIEESRGHFFTVVFTTKNGTERQMNAQYLKDQKSTLGYIKVRETGKLKTSPDNCIRNVNIQTLKKLSIDGTLYTIRK